MQVMSSLFIRQKKVVVKRVLRQCLRCQHETLHALWNMEWIFLVFEIYRPQRFGLSMEVIDEWSEISLLLIRSQLDIKPSSQDVIKSFIKQIPSDWKT